MPPQVDQAQAAGQAANGGAGAGEAGFPHGLDSGLAKAAPVADDLNQKTYRSYRRRLTLFSKQCSRRGNNVAVEGAFLVLSLLRVTAWEAAEQLNLDELEASPDPFSPIFQLLDRLYQYEDDVELPGRCEEFFQEFSRQKGEELQAYIIRHATLRMKMKEVGIDVPDLLAGWHLLSRAGVPKWTHLQVKSLCNGVLTYEKVSQALMKMGGGDHKPSMRDLYKKTSSNQESGYYVEYDNEPHIFFEEQHEDDWYQNEDLYYEDAYYNAEIYESEIQDDDVPAELVQAAEEMDDAYLNYVDSRRKMKEIALSRGFFPVVAIPPDWNPGSSSKGKSSPKGKGSQKEKERARDRKRAASGSMPSTDALLPESEGLRPRTKQRPPQMQQDPPERDRTLHMDLASSDTAFKTVPTSRSRTSPWLSMKAKSTPCRSTSTRTTTMLCSLKFRLGVPFLILELPDQWSEMKYGKDGSVCWPRLARAKKLRWKRKSEISGSEMERR